DGLLQRTRVPPVSRWSSCVSSQSPLLDRFQHSRPESPQVARSASRSAGLLLSAPEPVAGVRREARVRPYLAEDDVSLPLVAARDADGVLDPFHAGHPWPLDGGLDEVAREHGRGSRRTVELEPSALQ